MWAERERWRQRVRVGVFVVALFTLVTAWWRYERDPRSMPGLFSPADSWLGESPPTNRPAPANAAAGARGATGAPAANPPGGVGTTGRSGGSRTPAYRPGSPAGGTALPGAPSSGRVSNDDERVADEKSDTSNGERPSQPAPCEPRSESPQESPATPPAARAGAPPCEETQLERTPDPGAAPARR
jgi:hypothetical protein